MNIRKALINDYSKSGTERIINYVGDDKIRFKELMGLFFGPDPLLAQRAAWSFGYIGVDKPNLVKPYFKKLITYLDQPNHHDALRRNTMRVFENIDIPTKYCAILFDQCLKFITSELYPPAVRAFAITTATNISLKIPELKTELKLILFSLMEEQQKPAIVVRVRDNLKRL